MTEETIKEILKFRDDRDWKQFHNPKDLAISISLEAAELLEVFQWSGADVSNEGKQEKIKEELADVLVYSQNLLDKLELDADEIVNMKMKQNEAKYPVDKAKGNATKYTELQSAYYQRCELEEIGRVVLKLGYFIDFLERRLQTPLSGEEINMLKNTSEYLSIIENIKSEITAAQYRAAVHVNADIRIAFPESKGYSGRNLKYMAKFAETYSEREFVQQVVAQIPWGHNIVLLNKIADIKRLIYPQFYILKLTAF